MWGLIIILFLLILLFVLYIWQRPKPSPLTFIHIPKTGGEEIRRVGRTGGYEWVLNTVSPYFSCNFTHVPPSKFIKDSFTVVRNPYDRVVSEYKWRNPENQSVEGMNAYIQHALQQRDDYLDCHWLPQHIYARHAEHVLRFENLQEDFSRLMKKYNLPLVLDGHTNASKDPLHLSKKNLTLETVNM